MKYLVSLLMIVIVFAACDKDEPENNTVYVNGTYKAIEADYSYGYKGFLDVVIADDTIANVTFDYSKESGELKSEATFETYPMEPLPSIWLPEYEIRLQASNIVSFDSVDAITGATNSGELLNTMTKVLLEAAKTGDTNQKIIPVE